MLQANGSLIQGQVEGLDEIFDDEGGVWISLGGHPKPLYADERYAFGVLEIGGRVCAICEVDDEGTPVVVELVYAGQGEGVSIPQTEIAAMLARHGATVLDGE